MKETKRVGEWGTKELYNIYTLIAWQVGIIKFVLPLIIKELKRDNHGVVGNH